MSSSVVILHFYTLSIFFKNDEMFQHPRMNSPYPLLYNFITMLIVNIILYIILYNIIHTTLEFLTRIRPDFFFQLKSNFGLTWHPSYYYPSHGNKKQCGNVSIFKLWVNIQTYTLSLVTSINKLYLYRDFWALDMYVHIH